MTSENYTKFAVDAKPIFAIINYSNTERFHALVSILSQIGNVDVFAREKTTTTATGIRNCISVPDDIWKYDVDIFNFVLSWYATQKAEHKYVDAEANNYLHVLSDDIVFTEGCDTADVETFVTQLQWMMDTLQLETWMNTVCDPMNYVYHKYNPRVSILLDTNVFACPKSLGPRLNFTSHCNTAWMTFRMTNLHPRDEVKDDIYYFNTRFKVPMFHIIEWLARRKANAINGKKYCMMNMYPTIDAERGLFTQVDNASRKNNFSQDEIQNEDAIFKSLNLNIASDNNVDMLLETFATDLERMSHVSCG